MMCKKTLSRLLCTGYYQITAFSGVGCIASHLQIELKLRDQMYSYLNVSLQD